MDYFIARIISNVFVVISSFFIFTSSSSFLSVFFVFMSLRYLLCCFPVLLLLTLVSFIIWFRSYVINLNIKSIYYYRLLSNKMSKKHLSLYFPILNSISQTFTCFYITQVTRRIRQCVYSLSTVHHINRPALLFMPYFQFHFEYSYIFYIRLNH